VQVADFAVLIAEGSFAEGCSAARVTW
jgi:hypothetical protein